MAVLVGCTSPRQTGRPVAPITAAPASPSPPSAATHPTKVLLVMEENHTAADALDEMPRLRAAAQRYGYATDVLAVAHPSLPNYLALVGGSSFGITDDQEPPAHPVAGMSVFDEALAVGATARLYAEGMEGNCQPTNARAYGVRHNPWAYFSDPASRSACSRYDVPAGGTGGGPLLTDVRAGTLPTVGMLVPDVCHDGHDCPLSTADAWLDDWLQTVEHGPDWAAGRLVVVVTFDENDDSTPNTVLTVVIAPRIRHVTSARQLSHYSWTRYAAQLAGVPPLGEAVRAISLRDAFGL